MFIHTSFKLYKPKRGIDNYLVNSRINVRKTHNLRGGRSRQEIKGKYWEIGGELFFEAGNKTKTVVEIHELDEKVIAQLKADKLKTSKTGLKNVSEP